MDTETLKVKIKPSELVALEINGVSYEGFRKASYWEGFTKYERGDEFVIVATGDRVRSQLACLGIFEPEELAVIALSTTFFSQLRADMAGR